jgi:protein SCO1/2
MGILRESARARSAAPPTLLTTGAMAPDFSLVDQIRRPVTLSQFRGKVVAINFIYTSCAYPEFCFRIANHFGVLQRRFADRIAKDLVLLTVTFDPARDQPEVLAEYAKQWKADPDRWRFLSGPVAEIQRITDRFGVQFYPEEGLLNHSVRTGIIGRDGRLVANIEGNEHTAAQLGDLVQNRQEILTAVYPAGLAADSQGGGQDPRGIGGHSVGSRLDFRYRLRKLRSAPDLSVAELEGLEKLQSFGIGGEGSAHSSGAPCRCGCRP